MNFKKPVDEKIKKLAEMLKANGLASSDTQALEMAQDMSSTASRVQKAYDEQKTDVSQDTTDTKEVISKVEKKTPVERSAPEEVDPSKVDVGEVYNKQQDLIKNSFGGNSSPDKSVQDLVDEDAKRVYSDQFGDVPSQPFEPENPVSEPSPEESASERPSSPEGQVREQSSESVDRMDMDAAQPEKTVEIQSEKKSEDERKKEIEDMDESKVDLSDVFNFSK